MNESAAAVPGSGPGVFGAVADVYDEVRPGYPAALGARLLEFHGGAPAEIVEPAAGTGKGTELLVTLAASVPRIEPDPRMAAVSHGCADPAAEAAIGAAFAAAGADRSDRTEPDYAAELRESGSFTGVRAAVLEPVGRALDRLGRSVMLDLRATLVLAKA